MKKRAGCITLILLPLCLGLIIFGGDGCSGNSEEERRLFLKIEKGMSKDEVIAILGEPESMRCSEDSSNCWLSFFSKDKSAMRSELPYVALDSTGRVERASYGDGY